MTIPPDLEAQILRYYHVEKWRVGTIARQLHVHHGTVMRVLAQAGMPVRWRWRACSSQKGVLRAIGSGPRYADVGNRGLSASSTVC